jgi:NAD(P)-dependent dehydrogenase (short-subunit alcohol dehydrogenase family)
MTRDIPTLGGKTILLTGALGSLGLAQAEALAADGANLVLLDRPELALDGEQLASRIQRETGAAVEFVGQDLGDLEGSEARARAIAERSGAVDILINNAALIVNAPFETFSLAEYEQQIRVNSSAPFALVRAVAPGMKARSYGKIVNFCSITLNGRWDGYVPYVASKGAIFGLPSLLHANSVPMECGSTPYRRELSFPRQRSGCTATACSNTMTGSLKTNRSSSASDRKK